MRQRPPETPALQLVPRWMSVVLALVTIVGTTGATYATFGLRITALESRTDRAEAESAKRLEEYEQFKQHLATELQSLKDGLENQSETLTKIANRLGVIP